jgi:hypothetical protein
MKPSSTYKMSSTTKTILATIADPVKRSEWKRSMIQAELAAAIRPTKEKRKNDSSFSSEA